MEIDFRLSIVVAIVFIIVITIVVLIRIKFTRDEPFPVFLGTTRQPLPPFETGDFVFVSYRSIRGKLVKVFTGSKWTHMGMIFRRDSGDCVVIEAAYYDDSLHGVLETPLPKWLNWNRRRVLGWLPKRGPRISDREMDRVLGGVRRAEMDTLILSWLKAVVNRKYGPEPGKSKFYCSELCAYLCQELGIIEKVLMPASYSPKTFIERRLPLKNGHAFEEPRLFSVT